MGFYWKKSGILMHILYFSVFMFVSSVCLADVSDFVIKTTISSGKDDINAEPEVNYKITYDYKGIVNVESNIPKPAVFNNCPCN